MQVVDSKLVKVLDKIGDGYFSDVYKAEFNGEIFAYKMFRDFLDNQMINNIADLTQKDYDKHFLIPRYIVQKTDNFLHWNYLTKYYENSIELDDLNNLQEKINYLKQIRSLLEKLHTEYNRVHGDIHCGNIVANQDLKEAFLIDFDNCEKPRRKKEPYEHFNFSDSANYYLKYYPFNYELDTYLFNLATVSVLSGLMEDDVLIALEEKDFEFKYPHKVNKLIKNLTLNDPSKPYKKEYIIDYF